MTDNVRKVMENIEFMFDLKLHKSRKKKEWEKVHKVSNVRTQSAPLYILHGRPFNPRSRIEDCIVIMTDDAAARKTWAIK